MKEKQLQRRFGGADVYEEIWRLSIKAFIYLLGCRTIEEQKR